jgi:hypothetical protein
MHEHLHVHESLYGVRWRKSSASNPTGNCVELADLRELRGDAIAVRNSRHPNGPVLVYPRAAMAAFFSAIRAGEFDDLASRCDTPA